MDKLAGQVTIVAVIKRSSAQVKRRTRSHYDLIAGAMGAEGTGVAYIEAPPVDGDLAGKRGRLVRCCIPIIDVGEVDPRKLQDAVTRLGETTVSVDYAGNSQSNGAAGGRRRQIERKASIGGIIEALHSRPGSRRSRGIVLEIDRRAFGEGRDLIVGHAGGIDEVHAATEVEQATDPA